MIAHCLEEECEFGIVWVADDGLRAVGCACEIAEVLERMPDGRLNIVAHGTRPFRIEERRTSSPYPAGTVEFLEDDEERPTRGRRGRARRLRRAGRAGDGQDTRTGGARGDDRLRDGGDGRFGLDAKQGLLDLRSESARLRLVARLFRAALKRWTSSSAPRPARAPTAR